MHLDLAGIACSAGSACSDRRGRAVARADRDGRRRASWRWRRCASAWARSTTDDIDRPAWRSSSPPSSTRCASWPAPPPDVRRTGWRPRAGGHVRRGGFLGRRRAARRAGLRRHRRHDEAVLLRRRRPRPALLLARLDRRRATRSRTRSASRTTSSISRTASARRDRELRDEYARGRTPIPCVRCNSFTKFRDLLAHADALDCDWIATGHYAVRATASCYRGARSGQGPELFPLGHRPRGGAPHAHAGGRAHQARDPRAAPAR